MWRPRKHPATPTEPEPRGDSVEVLYEAAEAVMEDERERGRALDAKTAQLATFSGTILTLDVALGTFAAQEADGCVADIALPVFFLTAALALLAASVFAVGGVLRPQRYLVIDRGTLAEFARMPMLGTDPVELRGRLLTSITDIHLPAERSRNDLKATRTKWAAVALLVGLFAVAGQATTLGLDQLGV